jgi:hypothetical protein
MAELVRLYKLKRNTRIGVSHLNLENVETKTILKELNFHHVDGMYSLCTDDDGNIIHLKANTEVVCLG